jgi:hypothetical protein
VDPHVGAELAASDVIVLRARAAQHALVECAAEIRRRGAGEARPVATRHIGRERELADDQQAAARASLSPGSAQTNTSKPRSIEPVVRPATSTRACVTRWTSASIGRVSGRAN